MKDIDVMTEDPDPPISIRSTAPLSGTPRPKHDVSEENISMACNEFIKIVGPKHVISSFEERRARAHTPWSSADLSHTPALVVLPETTANVSDIMEICSRRCIPVTSYSGGTSMSGVLAATRGGICIDFKRMDKVLAVHAEDMDVIVQPAVGWQDLNLLLAKQDLYFPPDPGPGARIGGMIATGCSGTNAYRYGTMKDWVISMTIVLADGTIVKTGHRPRKSTAGYDLVHLMVGSEGTLGLVTEAVLSVTAMPRNIHVALAIFSTTHAAVKTAVALINSGLLLNAIELVDKYGLHAVNQSGLSQKHWQESPTLFLKFSGSKFAVQEQTEIVKDVAIQNGCFEFLVSGDKNEVELIWSARKDLARALISMKKDPTDLWLYTDTAVPISRLADIIEETQQVMQKAGFVGATIGHVGDGNYHASIICPKNDKPRAEEIFNHLRRRAVELEGTISAEHGIGLGLRDMLFVEVGETGVDMMRKIKLALDPKCILNCDKIMRME